MQEIRTWFRGALQPCPFCGDDVPVVINGEDENGDLVTSDTDWRIKCCICGAIGPSRSTPEDAALMWNVRGSEAYKRFLESKFTMVRQMSEARERFEKSLEDPKVEREEILRKRAIEMRANGVDPSKIARLLVVSQYSVKKWIARDKASKAGN